MTLERAAELAKPVSKIFQDWSHSHYRVDLVLGQDYLPSIDPDLFSRETPIMQVVDSKKGMLKRMRISDQFHGGGDGASRSGPNPTSLLPGAISLAETVLRPLW